MKDFKARDAFMLEVAKLNYPRPGDMEKIKAGDYDIFHYTHLSAENAETAIKNKWMDPKERQNESPTIARLVKFVKENPRFVLHGYVIVAERADARISVEGVIALDGAIPEKQYKAYVALCHRADEFDAESPMRAWWD